MFKPEAIRRCSVDRLVDPAAGFAVRLEAGDGDLEQVLRGPQARQLYDALAEALDLPPRTVGGRARRVAAGAVTADVVELTVHTQAGATVYQLTGEQARQLTRYLAFDLNYFPNPGSGPRG